MKKYFNEDIEDIRTSGLCYSCKKACNCEYCKDDKIVCNNFVEKVK